MSKNVTIKVFPSTIHGTVNVPSSKSLSHRALIAASLAQGISILNNITLSEDVIATINALKQIGAKFKINDTSIFVQGVKKIHHPNKAVYCNESGSTLRFLIPLFSATNKPITFTGKQSLLKRPLSIYKNLAEKDQISFIQSNDKIVVNGFFKGGLYHIDGSVSSQFFSGLMFYLPLLNNDTTIVIDGILESKSYINLTIQILQKFGIRIQEIENGYFIPGNQKYEPNNITIEGDYSQAAFFLVGGVLNGSVTTKNLSLQSLQGDQKIINIIKQMNGKIIYEEDGFIAVKSSTIGKTIDISNCPDLGPIISLLGAVSDGKTILTGAKRLRLKESDRIEAILSTLSKLGANIEQLNDDIIIHGVPSLSGGIVDSYNDHRIAMMCAMAALASENPVIITRANAVNKSYPNFFNDLKSLGMSIQMEEYNETD
jgi:3-phosphoshikimate 1-carboxyvinyltransferase